MKTMKIHFVLLLAGILNLFTAFLHLIGGQMALVVPMWNTQMTVAEQTQWLGAWHIVTVVLFGTSCIMLKSAFQKDTNEGELASVGWGYVWFGVAFIGSSIYMGEMAPQWILLLPIGFLTLFGLRKKKIKENSLPNETRSGVLQTP